MPNKLDFPKGKGSDVNIAIFVPSTKNITKKISSAQFKGRINTTVRFLRKEFGGSTRVSAIGDFFSVELNKSVQEKVVKVEVFTDRKTYLKKDKKIRSFLRKKKKLWGQESLAYEFQGKLFFI